MTLTAAAAASRARCAYSPVGSINMILPTTSEKRHPVKMPNTRNKADIIPAVPGERERLRVG